MLQTASMTVVILVGLYFLALGVTALGAPKRAQVFLLGFADSAVKHYLELGIRFIAGGAFVVYATNMKFAEVFTGFGWILLVTTFGLLLIPWRWHEKFAAKAVPSALRFLPLIGVSSLVMGAGLFYALVAGAV